jgi:hypothetical protein
MRLVPHLPVGVESGEVKRYVGAKLGCDPAAQRIDLSVAVVLAGDKEGGDFEPDVGLALQIGCLSRERVLWVAILPLDWRNAMDDAEYWREQAAQFRERAKTSTDPALLEELLDLAAFALTSGFALSCGEPLRPWPR